MGKRKDSASFPAPAEVGGQTEDTVLKKQSAWGEPWRPGEIPANGFMGRNVPHDIGATPYRRGVMDVEKPVTRSRKLPDGEVA